MTRTRASAKAAGSGMERLIADYLRQAVSRFIDKMPKYGSKDRGDIANLESHGQPIAVEVKNTAKLDLAGWAAEAEAERINLGALAGIFIHKRHGKGKAEDQWVTMTLKDFVSIINGIRPK